MAGQITGREAVLAALRSGDAIEMVLVDREKDTADIRTLCQHNNIPLEEGSTNDLWRMSAEGFVEALALTGRVPTGDLDEVLERGVSGADAVVLNVTKTHEERRTIRRSSMRADRFIPVVYSTTEKILQAAKTHNVRLIAVEDVGTHGPWDEDLTGDVMLVVGAEKEGISEQVLAAADACVLLPMDGFVPSYNLQVAVSVVAIEALRQRNLKKQD
jgi:tRNA (guanosine-2'-O-)-methyltransferase